MTFEIERCEDCPGEEWSDEACSAMVDSGLCKKSPEVEGVVSDLDMGTRKKFIARAALFADYKNSTIKPNPKYL